MFYTQIDTLKDTEIRKGWGWGGGCWRAGRDLADVKLDITVRLCSVEVRFNVFSLSCESLRPRTELKFM